MFAKLLIANRGEIAVRIARTARRMGIATVAIYSDADRDALHVRVADEAFRAGAAPSAQSYLNHDAIIEIAGRCSAGAIHPGYGFLAENPEFAEAVIRAGLVFVGPPPNAIRAMGHKDGARQLMARAGVPVVPGYDGSNQDTEHLEREAQRIGYPVLVKPVAGGGGKGMHRVDDALSFADALSTARREAASSFGDDRVLLERFVERARHIEMQVFADTKGNVVHLFERDCSLQRRHQKVIEEAPAPGLPEDMRAALGKAAVAAAKAVGYVGAGTVEFIADQSQGLRADQFYFMEMNTRLQVEHPVTEMITGLDLVEWQLRIASGEALPVQQGEVSIHGHAIEARLYAEDPARNFQPQSGKLAHLEFPATVRVDSGVEAGDVISPYYDPMIAKLIALGATRAEALHRLSDALAETRIGGLKTNLAFLNRLLRNASVASGAIDTGFIERNLDKLASAEPSTEAIAAALLHAAGYLSNPSGTSPFDTLTNFRLWPGERREFLFEAGGKDLKAALKPLPGGTFEVATVERTAYIQLLDHDGRKLHLNAGGHTVLLSYFFHGHTLAAVHAGAIYELTERLHDLTDGGEEEEDGPVVAAMPGIVTHIHVKPGDVVARGDAIAVTEAMKMEFTLRATRAGRVTGIHAGIGDQVVEGAVIATIEEGHG